MIKLSTLIFLILMIDVYLAQNVIVVVVDGARYTETFGASIPSVLIPHMWNDLMPQGTMYSNFHNTENTVTIPGHSALLTGTWQPLANDGTERPTKPTVFEYFRKEKSALQSENYVISGKSKLNILSYSTDTQYGSSYKASTEIGDLTDNEVYSNLVSVLDAHHPKLIIVNFPTVDLTGHSGNWNNYINAITNVDNLIFQLWIKIENDSYYQNNTTLFITNDHGRHTIDFSGHGDNCIGCQHIMLLAMGRNIPKGKIISELRSQIDIAPTIGDLLSFTISEAIGLSLFTPIELNLKIYLEGSYNNGAMTTLLSNEMPTIQPFNESPWNYSGIENVAEIPSGIVDWILIELRNDMNIPSNIHRAAFLHDTGVITDLDGVSPVKFLVPSFDYYITIKHRNHLEIMSSSTIYLSND